MRRRLPTSPLRGGWAQVASADQTPAERNQDLRIIFLAMLSASRASFCGMIGLELQPGRDSDGPRSPGSHFVTGCAAISNAKRAASSSRVSPINSRLFGFRCRGYGAFLSELIESFLLMPVLAPTLARGSDASRLMLPMEAVPLTHERGERGVRYARSVLISWPRKGSYAALA